MINKASNNNIIALAPNEVFVFGSNEAGIHGAGAAKTALKWGATHGIGIGAKGNTYAIPTKDKTLKALPINTIDIYVKSFIYFCEFNLQFDFLVTEIGCGLAGYAPIEIAPLFKDAIYAPNIYLPQSFIDILNK